MEIKNETFDKIMTEFNQFSQVSSELIRIQNAQILQMQQSAFAKQNELSKNLLNLASHLAKNGLGNYATQLEENVVVHLLNAPYDFKQAFFTHRALFAERHEMAIFLHQNLNIIQERVVKNKTSNKFNCNQRIKVFTYWDNDDNLPSIIAICRESMKKFISHDEFELIILNKNNYKDWTDFRQDDIQSNITQAHFTDLLRVKLLEKWGGFWLDATCLLTQDFWQATSTIRQQEQFLFSYVKSRTGTWFMYANCPNNYIVSMVSEAIQLWWERKGYLTNYFMLHDVIEMLYWIDAKYQNQWNTMLPIHPRKALVLLNNYRNVLSKEKFSELLNDSFIHKLTYKYDNAQIIPNSTLDKILSDNLITYLRKHFEYFDFNKLKNKIFVFSRKDGSHSRKMRLVDNFIIENIDSEGHENEYYWGREENKLVFKNKDNVVTGVFEEYLYIDNQYYIYGYFKSNVSLQFLLVESIN